jgi:hypothetical protein
MADDEKQQPDEIDKLIAADPNANLVEGKPQAWLLTGAALNVARAAVGRREANLTSESEKPTDNAR